jgi:predicted Zn finger-like uncharacterized protein
MILTCPECATSYFVEDGRIPPTGRRVRCSSCGHRWLAGPEGPIAEPRAPRAAAPESAAIEEPQAAPLHDDIEAAPVEAAPFSAPPLRRSAAHGALTRRSQGRSSVLVWAGAAVLAAALIAGVIVFREQIVRLWPKSSEAFAGLGLPVEGGGLVLEQIHAQPTFVGGRPVLSVTGAIHNVRDAPVNAPPVRLTLLNRAGQPVAAKIARPLDATIPPRGRRHFLVTMLDPPATARDLEVRFETGVGSPVRAAESVLAPGPAPRLPAAASAAPASAKPAPAAPPPFPAAPALAASPERG